LQCGADAESSYTNESIAQDLIALSSMETVSKYLNMHAIHGAREVLVDSVDVREMSM
jgi:hypothetical protein